MFLAINEILKEKSRFVLIVIVVILVSYLVFFLTALAYGLASSYTRALDKWDASGIIMSANANDTIGRSLLYSSDYADLLSDDVAPLGVGSATLIAESREDVALFGVEQGSFLAPDISEGRSISADNEVVLSDELQPLGIAIGDSIALADVADKYKVVGFTSRSTFQTTPVIYMSHDTWRLAASEASGMTGMRDDSTISALITRGDQKAAYTNDRIYWQSIDDFIFNLPGYRPQVLTFSLMIGFLIGIAAFVLSIFIYILTMQKKSIFGVLKAEGISSAYIARSVMVQVVIIAATGLLTGLALSLATGLLLAGKVPFEVNLIFFVGITLLFLLCAVLGGIASVRSVAKIDPVEAIG